MSLRVVLEVAERRAFASALDWPGWSRGAKTPDEALQALLDYADRYARVAGRAKVAKLNVQEAGAVATRYGVMSIPALLVFKGGKVVEQFGSGNTRKEEIVQKIEAHL